MALLLDKLIYVKLYRDFGCEISVQMGDYCGASLPP